MNLEELTNILARIDGRERQIIEAYLVRLRAARMIGRSGELGAMDMACALIGLNAAHRAAEAPEAVETFRNLGARLISGVDSEKYLPDRFFEARDFAETLARIIEVAPEIERGFETIIFETLATDPSTSLGIGGARAAMVLSAQIHMGAYPAGAIRVDTNLSRNWAYGRKQRARETVFETIFVKDDAPSRLDHQLPKRCLSISLQLPVFLAMHDMCCGKGEAALGYANPMNSAVSL